MTPPPRLGQLIARRWALASAAIACLVVVAAARAAYAYAAGPVLLLLEGNRAAVPGWLTSALGPALSPLRLVVVLVAIAAAKGVAYYGHRTLLARLSQSIVRELRVEMYGHVLRLAPSVLLEQRAGDLASRAAADAQAVAALVEPGLATLLRHLVTVAVVGVVAISLDPVLGAVALVGLPVGALVVVRTGRKSRAASFATQTDTGRLAGALAEMGGMVPLVRAYGAERQAVRTFARLADAARGGAIRTARLSALTGPALELLGALALAATLLVAAAHRAGGAPGELASFFACVFFLYRPIDGLDHAAEQVAAGLAARDRIAALLALPAGSPDPPGAVELPPLHGELRVTGLRWAYRDREVLRGVDLAVARGESLAVVGESGCGKTTLLLLLMRLLEPPPGAIQIDGTDLGAATRESVQRQFGWVTQGPLLFADSVLSNIALADAEPDRARAARAARAAGAHAFIAALPDGYDTVLAEAGAQLSGGQRQRLAIARALYRDAPVLLLDEATSSLDPLGEEEVSATIEGLLGTRTVVVVSHRLSTVRRAQRVVVLHEGRVAEQGTPDELWNAGGLFRRLFEGVRPAPAERS